MKKNIKYIIYSLTILFGLGSTISSFIIEVNYLDKDVIWQCLLGAGWTIVSLLIFVFGLIGVNNTIFEQEKMQKKKIYFNIESQKKAFKYKEKFIKLEDIKQFLLTTNVTEKIYILNQTETFSTIEVYMDFENNFSRKYDYSTKQFIIDKTTYQNIDEAIKYLVDNQFVFNETYIRVIGYEYSSPYHLQKRIENIKNNSF